jgi:hypothetical protein
MMFACLRLLTIALTLILTVPAMAQGRYALVVGNDSYQNIDRLQKAVNDARAMAASLQRLGFTVAIGENLSRRDFVQALARLEAQVRPGDMTFVFYAGHGVEIDGANYLLPVDVPKVAPGQQSILKDEAISTDGLIQRLKARGTRSQILVLDACRENPFRDTTGRSVGGARGLASAPPSTGVFILYSAGIGETALDRLSGNDASLNSVFTRTLVPLLERPDLSLVNLAKDVRAAVKSLAATVGHQQSPAYYDEIDGHLFLAKLGGGNAPPQVQIPPPVQAQPQAQASLVPVQPVVPAQPSRSDGFVFHDSDRRLLTPADVSRLSRAELRIARNEIYARKGRLFKSADLQQHFSRMPWYRGRFDEVPLNATEQANVNLLLAAER